MIKPAHGDWRFFSLVGVLVGLVALAPYLFGQALTPTGYQFQGNTVLAPGDPNVYYSYIEQARQGAVLMRDVFTSEAHPATLWQPVWLVLGWVAKITSLSAPVTYAIARIIAVGMFLLVARWAVRTMWPERPIRRAGLMLLVAGTGLSGIVVAIQGGSPDALLQLPPDVWVSEMSTLLSSWASPHFLLITSGYLFVLLSVERLADQLWTRRWLLVGMVSLLTLSIHPFHIITWVTLWLSLTIWRWVVTKEFPWKYVQGWVGVVVMSAPAMVYYLTGLLVDPIVIGRALQNINTSPSAWFVLLAMAPWLAIFAGGVIRGKSNSSRVPVWAIIWAAVQLLLIFLPFSGQRRLMQAMLIPWSFMAAPIVASWWGSVQQSVIKKTILAGALFVTFFSSAICSGWFIMRDYSLERNSRVRWEYFLSPEYQKLFLYVKTNVPADQVILSSLWNGNLLAGFTARSVVIGHPVETLRYAEKLSAVRNFYAMTDTQKQRESLQQYRACYILTGPRENAYGQGFQPQTWTTLQSVWSGPTMTLWRFTDCR